MTTPPNDGSGVADYRCSFCGDDLAMSGSHYHCGRCHDPKPTSMQGHHLRFDDGEWGFFCDEANLGKTWGRGAATVDASRIRPPHKTASDGWPYFEANGRPRHVCAVDGDPCHACDAEREAQQKTASGSES